MLIVIGIVLVALLVVFLIGVTSKNETVESNGFVWNRPIQDFVFEPQVESILRGCTSSQEVVSKAIFDYYVKGKAFRPALQTYLDICSTISNICHEHFGSSLDSNAGLEADLNGYGLMTDVGRYFANEGKITAENIVAIDGLIHPGILSVRPDWFIQKLESLKEDALIQLNGVPHDQKAAKK